MIYVAFTLYVAPVVVFVVAFWLLTAAFHSSLATNHESRITNITAVALFCAVVGLLIHNLIDFAIFEPGVFITFWAVIAALIAVDFDRKSRPQFVLKPAPFVKMLTSAGGLVLIWAYFNYALIPVAKSTAKIRQAQQAGLNGRFERAHNLLNTAAKDDCLSPAALSLNSRLYLQRFYMSQPEQADLLLRAEKSLLAAIKRNRTDFKNFKRLTEVYNLLAETSTQQTKTDWLNRAFDSARCAVERYPGSARLRIELAKIAEQLGKTDIAVEHYKKAVEIEDSYRRQFRQMYPQRQICSRLGEEKYNLAIERVKELSKESDI